MAGNIIGAVKGKTGFGKTGYKAGGMITKMNQMKASSASGAGRLEKAKKADGIKHTGKSYGKSNRLGGGGRFAQVEHKVAGKKGVYNPAGLAAYIGRKSLGKTKFQKLAAKGKAHHGK